MIRSVRQRIVHAALLLFAVALVVRAAQVQLWQGRAWAERARRQQVSTKPVPAPRGTILDESGQPLVVSQDEVRLSVAPREVRDRAVLATALRRAGVSGEWVGRATDIRRAWVSIPGSWLPSDAAAATALRGVYAEPVPDRILLGPPGIARLAGHVADDGTPLDGLELSLDSVLRGGAGTTAILRDGRGRRVSSPALDRVSATPGNTVQLTINRALQDICDRALGDAMTEMHADGGDIVVLDPRTGEIRALASRRADPRSTASTAFTEPFEPGSTVKPFIAASLLMRGLARASDVVNTWNGRFTIHGRTIEDSHRAAQLNLAQVIQWSSNIGIVQFAQRLSPGEEFEALRDAGFGAPTGVPYPIESPGVLRAPAAWSKQSAASMAMGYEISVTPVQLALAYGAIANGGDLMEPGLVREIRDPGGDLLYRRAPRVVRRLMSPGVARQLRGMLMQTVKRGTATQAELANFVVAGKTGTARRIVDGHYAPGQYFASFVGLFPAEAPQFVILVKLDNPNEHRDGMRGPDAYFGGRTAAPISKAILEAAIAARDVALDRTALAARERAPAAGGPAGVVAAREAGEVVPAGDAAPAAGAARPPVVIDLAAPAAASDRPAGLRAVPRVAGLPLRGAVGRLHAAGFQVELARAGTGAGATTLPAPGTMARAGTVVRLVVGGAR